MPAGKYVRVKVEERRDRIVAFAREHPLWSRKRIAKHFGVSLPTVANDFYIRRYRQREHATLRRGPRARSIELDDTLRTKLREQIIAEYGTDDPKIYIPLMRKKMDE